MVCYTVPLVSAIILFVLRKRFHSESIKLHQLNLLLNGGTIMLIIDHFWNRELFLIGKDISSDLLLGVLMTAGVFVFWGITVILSKTRVPAPAKFKG